MGIILSPRFLKGHIKQLRVFVSERNTMYTRLVGPLPPKLHFVEHYVQLIMKYGPAVCYWTMQFESKHRELRHSFNQLAGTCGHSLQYCDVTYVKKLQKRSDVLSLIPAHYQVRSDIQLYSTIIVHREKYSCHGIVVLRFCDGEPEFGMILALFPFNRTEMILIKRSRTLFFDDHCHAYRIKVINPEETFVLSIETLPSPCMCSYVLKGDKEYVVCKHVL